MSELANVWEVRVGGTTRWCRKHGMSVTGCAHHFDCKDCEVPEKEVIHEPKRIKTRKRKPRIQPRTEDIDVKKRARTPRIRPVIGKTSGKKPKKVSKSTGGRRLRRGAGATHQERLGT